MSTDWDRPASAWPLGAWAMAGMLAIVTGVGVSASVLAPGILLDGISLWPGLVPVLVALVVTAIRKGWRRRSGAIAPLLLITWLLLVGAAHLSGWVALPSSAGELYGPTEGPELGTVSIKPVGRLKVEAGSGENLYQVRFLRLGGPVGAPRAEEVTSLGGVSVTVTEDPPDPWFRFAGWILRLDPGRTWNLDLGGQLSGDLSDLVIGSLTLSGEGEVTLAQVDRPVAVSVMGSYQLVVPAGTAVTVSGPVTVPEGWVATEGGFSSGVAGEGYVIRVAAGGSLLIRVP